VGLAATFLPISLEQVAQFHLQASGERQSAETVCGSRYERLPHVCKPKELSEALEPHRKECPMKKVFCVSMIALIVGCGNSGLKPAVTREQYQKIKEEELSGERKVLDDLEKKYGPNHPQVKQMRMELGLDPMPGGGE
jgi:hypothetical protein